MSKKVAAGRAELRRLENIAELVWQEAVKKPGVTEELRQYGYEYLGHKHGGYKHGGVTDSAILDALTDVAVEQPSLLHLTDIKTVNAMLRLSIKEGLARVTWISKTTSAS